MQKVEIIKQNFYISSENVPYALKDLKELYPQITGLDYEADTSNLQYLLWVLGLHVRIQVDGSIFTISKLPYDAGKIDDIDYDKIFKCLCSYISEDSYINAKIDGDEYRYNDPKCWKIVCESIIEDMLEEMDKVIGENNETLSQLDESEPEGELVEEEEGSMLIEDVVQLTEKEELKPTTTLNQKKKGRPKKT